MEQGKCPKCDSDDLDYKAIESCNSDVASMYYPFTCNSCGFEGKEHYNLHFTGFTDENNVICLKRTDI
ncbi:MAG: hypothetical protein DRO67_04910 [Candidatus Asgardarchaeum californiense]|nr:MAG: hypothetical protein DRO67_04910 [Candidatus Asgardarchaeum californiense]